MNLILIRHGKTPSNLARAYCGSRDETLSGIGIDEIRKIGSFPDVPSVYITPLQRTRQTARLIFPNADLVVAEGLREMCFGRFEGHTAEEMVDDAEYRSWVDGSCEDLCPGGECRADFEKRTADAFYNLVAEACERGEERVICVVHGGTIMSVMHSFATPARSYFDWYVQNGCGWAARADMAAWHTMPLLTAEQHLTPKTLSKALTSPPISPLL